MAEAFLYLTTTGHKSGEPRQIEIWFAEHAGRHYIVSERREASKWVKNLKADPRVSFSVGPRDAPASKVPQTAARARIVDSAREPELAAAVRARMDEKYGWSDGLIVELDAAAPAG